jgi:hypothetical protein
MGIVHSAGAAFLSSARNALHADEPQSFGSCSGVGFDGGRKFMPESFEHWDAFAPVTTCTSLVVSQLSAAATARKAAAIIPKIFMVLFGVAWRGESTSGIGCLASRLYNEKAESYVCLLAVRPRLRGGCDRGRSRQRHIGRCDNITTVATVL